MGVLVSTAKVAPLKLSANNQNIELPSYSMLADSIVPEHEIDKNPLPLWLRWNRTSPQLLIESESKLLQRLRSTLKGFFVPIFGGNCLIRTVIAKLTDSPINTFANDKMPVVMVHGFASGLGLWCKNVDAIAAHRPVYTFDLLGFGRSSRPNFPTEASEVESHWVESVEEWRTAIKLDKFIMIGHSLGGYISTAYALRYPQRVAHLILVDPWGFSEVPFDDATVSRMSHPVMRAIRGYLSRSSPLALLRAIGPLGRSAIHRVRGDLRGAFDQRYLSTGEFVQVPSYAEESAYTYHPSATSDSETESNGPQFREPSTNEQTPCNKPTPLNIDDLDGSIALDYVYHINVQHPSGEVAFKSLCSRVPWAMHPMIQRVDRLDASLPITFIFGSRSWMDISSGTQTKAKRPESYVDVKIIEGAGHQVYAQAAEEFNACVNEVASRVDAGEVFRPHTNLSESPSKPVINSPSDRSPMTDRLKKRRRSSTTQSSKSRLFCSRVQGNPENGDEANDEASS